MFGCMLKDCKRSFINAHDYLNHLKDYHMTPTVFKYICTVQKCGQIFSSFFPFKKHTISHQAGDRLPSFENQNLVEVNVNSESHASDETTSSKKIKLVSEISESSCTWGSLSEVDRSAFNFTLKLHAKNNFNRKDVYTVQNEVTELLTKLSDHIASLNASSSDVEDDYIFKSTLTKMKVLFSEINSDYKLLKYVRHTTGLPAPSIVTIDNCKKSIFPIQELETDQEISKNYLIIMPISMQIKTFFECENVFEQTINNQNQLENSSQIVNFVNGTTWQQVREKYVNETVIPIWLYADEFEVNDSQSSHSNRHSVCGIYFSFPTIPKKYASKLNNIFVAGMLKKVDIKEVGINKLLSAIIEAFTQIEVDGIKLNINGEVVLVKFVLSLLQGDNLGIHSMLSFSSGFNATFYCRFCRRPKELLKVDASEHADCLRRRVDYDEDLKTDSLSDTGIARNSLFNCLPSFHVTENRSVDAMHDFFSSGLCKYGLTEVLNYCIFTKKYFTVKDVNVRKREVAELSLDSELSRMPDLTESFSSKDKRKSVCIKTTSNEMRVFCHNFSLLIGQYVPLNDQVWNYAIKLIQLVDLCLRQSFSIENIDEMKCLIAVHHTLYKDLFKKDLTPKHHFLVHYPSIILSSGPICNMMCFRNEAKHKGFKQYAHVMASRKNICYTLCVKSYLQFTNDLLNNTFFRPDESNHFHLSDLRLRNYFCKIIQPLSIATNFQVSLSSSVVYKNIRYKQGQFVAEFCSNTILLYEIIEVLLYEEKYYLILQQWNVSCFHEHYQAYECTGSTGIVEIIEADFFTRPPFSIIIINRGIKDKLTGTRMLFRIRNAFDIL